MPGNHHQSDDGCVDGSDRWAEPKPMIDRHHKPNTPTIRARTPRGRQAVEHSSVIVAGRPIVLSTADSKNTS